MTCVLRHAGRQRGVRGGGGPSHNSRDVLRCTAAFRARSTACAVIASWGFYSQARSSLMAAMRPRCRGKGVSPGFTGRRGREFTTPAVGLRSRRCVVKPDPITPHGQSSRGAAEGEGRFPTAMAAAILLPPNKKKGKILRGRKDFKGRCFHNYPYLFPTFTTSLHP